jgi:eukaryotic-like serine/threonine-protein kinase
VIYPTGPGETRRLPRGSLEGYSWARWFPDGKHVLLSGNEAGRASRCYTQDISGGAPRPVTPEGTAKGSVSPDGRRILCSKPGEGWVIQGVDGGEAQTVPGLAPDDEVIRWSGDGKSVYVYHPVKVPFRFERVDLATGSRELIREVAPSDRTGVLRSYGASLTEDARFHAYDYYRESSQLFVVDGAR